MRRWQQTLPASVLAALLTSLAANPFEVLKLRNQTNLKAGLRFTDLFRGSLQNSNILVISSILFINSYEMLLEELKSHLHSETAMLLSSVMSRALATTATLPLEASRIRRSLRLPSSRLDFQGLKITLVRDITFAAVYWPSVQLLRSRMSGADYRSSQRSLPDFVACNVVPATLAGMFTVVLTTPFDHLKTLVQSGMAREEELGRTLRQAWGEGQLRRGLGLRMAKAGVHCPVFLLSYECAVRGLALGQ